MKKRILPILIMFVLWTPGMICAEDAMRGEVMRPTPADPTSEEPPLDYGPPTYMIPSDAKSEAASSYSLKEWYIVEKIPTGKGLVIGVFLFQEGMSIEHIQSVFGKPQETIGLDTQEGPYRTILVYAHHHFFFSKTGSLQAIKERKPLKGLNPD